MTGRTRWTLGAAITLAAILYCAPLVPLWQATGRSLVPWASAETYLYMSLSHLQADADGLTRNPWYGNSFPAAEVAYVRFGLGLRLFHRLSTMTGNDATALMAWHLILALVTAWALTWMLRAVTLDPYVLLAAFAVLMFVDASYARYDLRTLRTGAPAWIYGFPFARVFFPQVGVPLLFASLGCLLRWLTHRGRHRWLVLIGLLQPVAFFAFPFAAVVITGSVGVISCAALLLGGIDRRGFTMAVILVIVSLVIDAVSFVTTGLGGLALYGPRIPFHFDLSQLHDSQLIIRLFVLGALALIPRSVATPVRVVLGGFPIAVAMMLLTDAFVSPGLQMGHHIAYFYSVAWWLPLIAIGIAGASHVKAATTHAVASAAIVAIVIFALLDARATARTWRPYNEDNGQLARALVSLQMDERDVVLMPVRGFHGDQSPTREASLVPLVSRATVLYSPAGRFLLPSGSPEDQERLAAYLFVQGRDVRWLDAALRAPAETNEQHVLAGYGREFFLSSSARDATLADIRRELEPRLEAFAHGSVPHVLLSARRIIVADSRTTPVFKADRLDQWLATDSVVEAGAWHIQVCRPRQ